MKRYIPLLALVLAIATLFSGCSNWMEGEYLSVTPHQNKDLETEVDAVQITTYGEMRRHLAQAVESGALAGTISYMGVDRETATDYMDIACRYLNVCNAVYAYAVKKVTYSINQVENTTQISYQIEYYHGRSEVLRIQQVDSVDGASEVVYSALERGGNEVALMINPYVQINFEQMIKDLAEKNPNVVMEIPKINVNLPIYHGTNNDSLERGVGHLLGSSLPVGGESTHTILTAHSGMASQKMFSDLDLMKIDDVFYLDVLNERLAYQVDAIFTVLPHETEQLQIVTGKDYCTLVTCTPFGVNTHRLLVRGTRIPYEEAEEILEQQPIIEEPTSTWEEKYMDGIITGICIVLILAILAGVVWYIRRK